MLTFTRFSGINNVLPSERLTPDPSSKITPLAKALNVDVGNDHELLRREGYTVVDPTCHKNLHQADGFMLATCNGDLKVVGGAVLYPSLGVDRVWYCNLPDGRTTFSNGLINGITDGVTATKWGVPIPSSIGAFTDVSGDLFPGTYQYAITHVRLSDGMEGGPEYSNHIAVESGGVFLSGLPQIADHKINVYLSSNNDDNLYLAGSTTTGVFSYTGKNDALTLPCRTAHLYPAVTGTVTAFWRGRVLVAKDNVLWASRPHQYELFDRRRDFKQFKKPITLIQPVDNGVYVGTEEMLYFLSGTEFDKLQQMNVLRGRVVLGSGTHVPGELIRLGDGVGSGDAMMCIADKGIVAGFSGGTVVKMTEGRYETDVTEVASTFRKVRGIPQYIAVEL